MTKQATRRIPEQLLDKMRESPEWGSKLDFMKKYKQRDISGIFRTSLGVEINLIFSDNGIIHIQNDLSARPEGMRTPREFTFKDEDIVTWCVRRKVKTGWWPWQWRLETVELVSIKDKKIKGVRFD